MFKVVKFDSNNEADSACKELFSSASPVTKKKNKVKKGKITKRKVKQTDTFKNEEKIKDEIRAILQNGVDSIHTTKIKTKKKKLKSQEKQVITVEQKNEKRAAYEKRDAKKQGNVVDEAQKKKGKKRKKENLQEISRFTKSELSESNSETTAQQKKKKRKKKKPQASEDAASLVNSPAEAHLDYNQKKRNKIREKIQNTLKPVVEKKPKAKNLSLRERMMQKLQAARFRFINEQIYSTNSKEAQKIFVEDPEAFHAYHEGYRQQVNKWPLNPVDVVIKSIQRLPKSHIIADFGCGDAKLAKSVTQKVHSFDLVAANNSVTACDMAHVPLQSGSVDVVVFCLSLMGTNLHDYLLEANRVLKPEGILKIAEVESRFDDVNQFIEALKRFHFKNTWKDLSHNLFYFLDFKKEANIKNKKKLPTVSLQPCLYKKR